MKTFTYVKVTAAVIGLFVIVPAFAQSDKINLRVVPQPNQTIQMKMVQETEMRTTFEGNAAAAVAGGPITTVATNVATMTQKVGPADAEGRIESEMTYGEMRSEISMNGQPMRPNDAGPQLTGKKFTVTYDKQGNVVDMKIPADIGLPDQALREMLQSFYGRLPGTLIGVGESASSPLDFNLPLPMPGAALKMEGSVTHKLVSLERDGAGRIANIEQTIEGRVTSEVEMPSATGKLKMSLDFKMGGGGAAQLNIDKGILRSSESKATLNGTMKMTGDSNAFQMPPMSIVGTVKTTISSN